MKEVTAEKVYRGPSPLSAAVRAGDVLLISGQVPRRTDGEWVTGPFRVQAQCVLDNLMAVVVAAGGTRAAICKVGVYLAYVEDFEELNQVYRDYFGDGPFPARTTIRCDLMRPGIRIEMDGVAWLGTDQTST